MHQSQLITSADQLLQQDVFATQVWLEDVKQNVLVIPNEFNWLGLAYGAASNAHSFADKNQDSDSLAWAGIANHVYRELADQVGFPDNEPFLYSTMMMCAGMVKRFGDLPGHPILDTKPIIQWVISGLEMPVEEAMEKACAIKIFFENHQMNDIQNYIDDIQKLRRAKNRLNMLLLLSESCQIQLDGNLIAWLNLKQQLP